MSPDDLAAIQEAATRILEPLVAEIRAIRRAHEGRCRILLEQSKVLDAQAKRLLDDLRRGTGS